MRPNSGMGMGGMMPGMGMGGMMPGMGMGGMMPGMGMGRQDVFSKTLTNIGNSLKKSLSQLRDFAYQLNKHGLAIYIILIIIGILIFYSLRFLIGLKIGRDREIERVKREALGKN